jgi:hypothetical protein
MRQRGAGRLCRACPQRDQRCPAFLHLAVARQRGQFALPHGHEILGQAVFHAASRSPIARALLRKRGGQTISYRDDKLFARTAGPC